MSIPKSKWWHRLNAIMWVIVLPLSLCGGQKEKWQQKSRLWLSELPLTFSTKSQQTFVLSEIRALVSFVSLKFRSLLDFRTKLFRLLRNTFLKEVSPRPCYDSLTAIFTVVVENIKGTVWDSKLNLITFSSYKWQIIWLIDWLYPHNIQ